MNAFEMLAWVGAVAVRAAVGWRVDGERGAAIASLLPPMLLAVARSRARRRAEVVPNPPASDASACWRLTRTQALVEVWARGDVRFLAVLATVIGWPALIALVVRRLAGMPTTLPWRWAMLVVASILAPAFVAAACVLADAVSALRHRERSAEWTGSVVRMRTPCAEGTVSRESLDTRPWRGVVLVTDSATSRVVAVPREVAVSMGWGVPPGD